VGGRDSLETNKTYLIGPRHPATSFLLRLAVMAIVGAIADLALPESQFKSLIIVGCFMIGALWLYMEASQVPSVRVQIDAKARRVNVQKQFIVGKKRSAYTFEEISMVEVNWTGKDGSIEAEYTSPSANSVVLVMKDEQRKILLSPSHLDATSSITIRNLEQALQRALGSAKAGPDLTQPAN
jgi:hypothetical protein